RKTSLVFDSRSVWYARCISIRHSQKHMGCETRGGKAMSVLNREQVTRRFVKIVTLCVGLVAASQSFAQGKSMATSNEIGNASRTNCVILERMGTVGQVTSRMLSLGVH